MLDIHCHILPGVDDGAASPAAAEEMLLAARDAGIRRIVATPHLYDCRADLSAFHRALASIRGAAAALGIRLLLGYEIAFLANAARMDEETCRRVCVEGTRSVLIELPYDRLPPKWEFALSEILRRGYFPIIVHPERFAYVQRDQSLSLPRAMREMGCEIQIDADGLFALPFSAQRRCARAILRAGLADYVASDAHSALFYRDYKKAREFAGEKWPSGGRLEKISFPKGARS